MTEKKDVELKGVQTKKGAPAQTKKKTMRVKDALVRSGPSTMNANMAVVAVSEAAEKKPVWSR